MYILLNLYHRFASLFTAPFLFFNIVFFFFDMTTDSANVSTDATDITSNTFTRSFCTSWWLTSSYELKFHENTMPAPKTTIPSLQIPIQTVQQTTIPQSPTSYKNEDSANV